MKRKKRIVIRKKRLVIVTIISLVIALGFVWYYASPETFNQVIIGELGQDCHLF